jgi:chromosome segregation ATPase
MLKLAIEIDAESPLEYEIRGDKTTIGRSHDNDFRIRNSYVSAFHAEVFRLPSGDFEIVDLGSFNGTFVNGSRIDRAVIAPGDQVSIGTLKGRVLGANGHAPAARKERSGPVVAPLRARKPDDSEPPPAPANGAARKAQTAPRAPAKSRQPAADATAPGELEELRARIAGVEMAKSHLEKALEASQASVSRLDAEVSTLRSRASTVGKGGDPDLKRLQAELETAIKREAKWREKADANDQAVKHLASVEADLADARAFILHEQQSLADLRAKLSEETATRSGKEDAEAKLRGDLAESRARQQKAEAGLGDLTHQLGTLSAANAKLVAEKTKLSQEASELRDRLAVQEMTGRGAAESQARETAREKARLEAAEGDLAAVRQSASRLEAELAARDESIEALEAQLQDSNAKLRELLSSKSRTEEDADQKIAQLHARISELKLESENASTDVERYRGEAEEAKKARSKLALAESIAVRELAEARLAGSQTQSQVEELEAQLDEARQRAMDFETALAESRRQAADHADLDAELLSARQQIQEWEARLAGQDALAEASDLSKRQEAVESRLAELQAQIAKAVRRLEDLHRETRDAEAQAEKRRNALSAIESEAAERNAEFSRLATESETAKSRIAEYEDYHRTLRESLRLDHATVQIFSQQLIRKLDHVEDLIGTCRSKGDHHTVRQLETLKESFLDLLSENSVRTYSFDPGTELNVDHRRMIHIVETRQSGNQAGPARVFATVRPGYVCAGSEEGDERILRKAEVITHG